MTATIDATVEPNESEVSGSGDDVFSVPQQAARRTVIAVELLTAHPGNVRRDVSLDQEFLDSISELGILTPLRITPDGTGGYRVIEGHRRLAAAEKLGITEIPYDLAPDREEDEAGQFLDMYATNHHRKGFSVLEEADALFAASAKGASKTRIRKATGLDKDDVAAALKAGRMTGFAREVAAGFGQDITLDQIALLAEFEDDTEAVNRLMNDFCNGRTGQHVAEAIRQERTEVAAREQLTVQLTADGYAITTHYPDGRLLIAGLAHDGQDLTPEAHAACPGRAVYLNAYNQSPTHFCTDPDANGHTRRHQGSPLPDLRRGSDDTADGTGASPDHRADPGPDPARRLVVEGNRAWTAAATVRMRWLADTLLSRRTPPKQAMAFITSQLLAMPAPLRDAFTHAARTSHFNKITGGTIKHSETGLWPAGRLPVAILALIAAAYEERMDGDAGRETWRTDRPYPRCPRDDAGTYFRFLNSAGYELSGIEQAVADGVPYTGDRADDTITVLDQDASSVSAEASEDLMAATCDGPVETGSDDGEQPAGGL